MPTKKGKRAPAKKRGTRGKKAAEPEPADERAVWQFLTSDTKETRDFCRRVALVKPASPAEGHQYILGRGEHSLVFAGETQESKEPVCVKVEVNSGGPGSLRLLEFEFRLLRSLHASLAQAQPKRGKAKGKGKGKQQQEGDGLRVLEMTPFGWFKFRAEPQSALGQAFVNVLVTRLYGPTLRDWWQTMLLNTPSTAECTHMLAHVGEQCARALQQCHRGGVVHRDVQPKNFCVGLGEVAVDPALHLIDFGLALRADDLRADAQRGKGTGIVVGTHPYTSSTADAMRPQTEADDYESVVYMLWECLLQFTQGREHRLPWAPLDVNVPAQLTKVVAAKAAKKGRPHAVVTQLLDFVGRQRQQQRDGGFDVDGFVGILRTFADKVMTAKQLKPSAALVARSPPQKKKQQRAATGMKTKKQRSPAAESSSSSSSESEVESPPKRNQNKRAAAARKKKRPVSPPSSSSSESEMSEALTRALAVSRRRRERSRKAGAGTTKRPRPVSFSAKGSPAKLRRSNRLK